MARLSDYDRENIDKIMEGHGNWFSAQLLRLCHKADPWTLDQIRRGFPDHVELYETWKRGSYLLR